MIELRAVTKQYDFSDDGGYSFRVTATLDPEWGWEASVSMVSHGHHECDGAVLHLREAARAFLRMLENDATDEATKAGGER